jgi:hypothetical protein
MRARRHSEGRVDDAPSLRVGGDVPEARARMTASAAHVAAVMGASHFIADPFRKNGAMKLLGLYTAIRRSAYLTRYADRRIQAATRCVSYTRVVSLITNGGLQNGELERRCICPTPLASPVSSHDDWSGGWSNMSEHSFRPTVSTSRS